MSTIRINKTRYIFSHGKEPRGKGTWAFSVEGSEPIFVPGNNTMREAAAQAVRMKYLHAAPKGAVNVVVLP